MKPSSSTITPSSSSLPTVSSWQGPDPQNIKNLFSSIAQGYDQANDWISLGRAASWRRTLVRLSQIRPGFRVLDCATGTGDLALEFAKKLHHIKGITGAPDQIVGVDFCQDMLALAPQKAKALGFSIQFEQADVMKLPFPAQSFDVVSIAYGIRNVKDPLVALKEMARVVRPGGYVMVLETGSSSPKILQFLMNLYFRQIVPRLGGWITGRRQAYEYLNRSSLQFPSREQFVNLMSQTGQFKTIDYCSLMGGASFIYRGQT